MYVGGRNKNKSKHKRQKIGVKDRATNTIRASPVATTDWETLSRYVRDRITRRRPFTPTTT